MQKQYVLLILVLVLRIHSSWSGPRRVCRGKDAGERGCPGKGSPDWWYLLVGRKGRSSGLVTYLVKCAAPHKPEYFQSLPICLFQSGKGRSVVRSERWLTSGKHSSTTTSPPSSSKRTLQLDSDITTPTSLQRPDPFKPHGTANPLTASTKHPENSTWYVDAPRKKAHPKNGNKMLVFTPKARDVLNFEGGLFIKNISVSTYPRADSPKATLSYGYAESTDSPRGMNETKLGNGPSNSPSFAQNLQAVKPALNYQAHPGVNPTLVLPTLQAIPIVSTELPNPIPHFEVHTVNPLPNPLPTVQVIQIASPPITMHSPQIVNPPASSIPVQVIQVTPYRNYERVSQYGRLNEAPTFSPTQCPSKEEILLASTKLTLSYGTAGGSTVKSFDTTLTPIATSFQPPERTSPITLCPSVNEKQNANSKAQDDTVTWIIVKPERRPKLRT